MCRPRDLESEVARVPKRRSLKIDSVTFHLNKKPSSSSQGYAPGVGEADWVNLVLMPRIDGSPLVVNGSNIAPDMPAFITLHRKQSESELLSFRSRWDKVEGLCDGLSFEVHLGQHCLMRGVFRCWKGDWKMECKWVAKSEIGGILGISEAELSVGVDQYEYRFLSSRVVVKEDNACIGNNCTRSNRWRGRRRKRCGRSFKMCLPDIPEVDQEGDDDDDDKEECCGCNCGGEYEDEDEMEVGVGDYYEWAFHASFWAVCVGLGLGFVVSRTSKRSLALSKFLPL